MSRVYDNWERLVGAVRNREELRLLALCSSFSSSSSADFSADSFDANESSRIYNETINLAGNSRSSSVAIHVQPIQLKEIKKATRNFRRDLILGEGAFGTVYKGWLYKDTLCAAKPGSGMAVAVKMHSPHSWVQGRKEWLDEIKYLSKLHHPNVVKLIGYCSEEDHLVLVYEFMPKGSLDNHLRRYESLCWATRIRVAIGAARALSFLHDREIQVIHRGFRCGDILLDGDFNAKLSDFGLAKDGPTGDMTHVSTRVVGRQCYIAPEYAATGHLTAKCDVYGFGVVLLQLLAGNRRNLVEWANPYLLDKRKFIRIIDTNLGGKYPSGEAYTVAKLAFECLSPNPNARPQMTEVLCALEQLQDLSN